MFEVVFTKKDGAVVASNIDEVEAFILTGGFKYMLLFFIKDYTGVELKIKESGSLVWGWTLGGGLNVPKR